MTAARIGTVTLNPAIDVTYQVPTLRVDDVVRVRRVRERAGGKGVNVAAVAASLGAHASALVLTGGRTGTQLIEGLAALGLNTHPLNALEDVRRTVAVVADDGTTTSLQETGRPVRSPQELIDQVLHALDNMLAEGVGAVAVSGSLPPGCPVELPALIARRCRQRKVPVVVDTSGAALAAAADCGAILTPNHDELAELLGDPATPITDVVAASQQLLDAGAPAVIVTLGREGLICVAPGAAFIARPPRAVQGNPTGAGDAAVAALLLHLAAESDTTTLDWPKALADMVATSAACVLSPVAGEIDPTARQAWLPKVPVEPVRTSPQESR